MFYVNTALNMLKMGASDAFTVLENAWVLTVSLGQGAVMGLKLFPHYSFLCLTLTISWLCCTSWWAKNVILPAPSVYHTAPSWILVLTQTTPWPQRIELCLHYDTLPFPPSPVSDRLRSSCFFTVYPPPAARPRPILWVEMKAPGSKRTCICDGQAERSR